jgi:hypothetical protein
VFHPFFHDGKHRRLCPHCQSCNADHGDCEFCNVICGPQTAENGRIVVVPRTTQVISVVLDLLQHLFPQAGLIKLLFLRLEVEALCTSNPRKVRRRGITFLVMVTRGRASQRGCCLLVRFASTWSSQQCTRQSGCKIPVSLESCRPYPHSLLCLVLESESIRSTSRG